LSSIASDQVLKALRVFKVSTADFADCLIDEALQAPAATEPSRSTYALPDGRHDIDSLTLRVAVVSACRSGPCIGFGVRGLGRREVQVFNVVRSWRITSVGDILPS